MVMLAHGFGCDQNMWRLVAPALARDFRVVLFDHVGSGRSDLSAWDGGAVRDAGRVRRRRPGDLPRSWTWSR